MVLASWFYSTPPQKWTTFETGFGCAKQPANKLHWHRPQIEEVSEKPLGISWDAGSTEVPCHPGPFNMFLKPIHGIPAQANEVNPCKKDMFVHVNPIASIEIILHKHMFTIYIYIYVPWTQKNPERLGDMFTNLADELGRKFKRRSPERLQSTFRCKSSLVGGWPTPLKNDGVRQLGWWNSQYIEK